MQPLRISNQEETGGDEGCCGFFSREMVHSGDTGAALPISVQRLTQAELDLWPAPLPVPAARLQGVSLLCPVPCRWHSQCWAVSASFDRHFIFFSHGNGWEEDFCSFSSPSAPAQRRVLLCEKPWRWVTAGTRQGTACGGRQTELHGRKPADFRQTFVQSWLGPGRRVPGRCSYQDGLGLSPARLAIAPHPRPKAPRPAQPLPSAADEAPSHCQAPREPAAAQPGLRGQEERGFVTCPRQRVAGGGIAASSCCESRGTRGGTLASASLPSRLSPSICSRVVGSILGCGIWSASTAALSLRSIRNSSPKH